MRACVVSVSDLMLRNGSCLVFRVLRFVISVYFYVVIYVVGDGDRCESRMQ